MAKEKKGQEERELRPIRVRSIHDASRLLARVLMQLQKDQVSESKARSISYVCNSYVKAFEISELEKRLTELEERVSQDHSSL